MLAGVDDTRHQRMGFFMVQSFDVFGASHLLEVTCDRISGSVASPRTTPAILRVAMTGG